MATEKVSITLDEELLRAVRERVGGRGLSAYVNEALRRDLQHDRIRDFLAAMEEEQGPIPEEVMEEVRREWDAVDREMQAKVRQSA